MGEIIGPNVWVFLGLTVVLFGGAAWMTGQALAATWRPAWHMVPYALLMSVGDNFLTFALFSGDLLSLPAFLGHAVILWAIAMVSYRMTQVAKMVAQYPWLYERAGVFAWRDRAPQG
ncbi:MAG: hypothetical protein J0H82_23805 [Alphaproteobacteria bacterium]|jgi:hypothetical protein|nr:hypothetical protein [Alphaproteobacteria bacterium]